MLLCCEAAEIICGPQNFTRPFHRDNTLAMGLKLNSYIFIIDNSEKQVIEWICASVSGPNYNFGSILL